MNKVSALALFSSLSFGSAAAAATTLPVDCNAGATVGAALARAKAGDELVVSGTCRENVLIPSTLHGITIRGAEKATIVGGPDPTRAVITILGREIVIRDLRLAGGRNGINVLRSGTARIDGVTIEDSGATRIPGSGLGINIGQHAFAAVIRTTIRNNWNVGILVHENSSARIGFVDAAAIVGGNTIAENGIGILINSTSQARVIGTTIIGNKREGIRVEETSQLGFADNTIEGNGDNGVTVTRSAGAVVEISALGSVIVTPNRTRPEAMNLGFGIACSLGGYVSGSLGTLAGVKGKTTITNGCTNALTP